MDGLLDPRHVALGLWIVLAAVWVASSVGSRRTVQRESLASRASYSAVLSAGMMLVFVPARILQPGRAAGALGRALPPLLWRLWPASGVIAWVGVAMVAAGVAYAIWARVTLGRLWSGIITLKEGHHLVTAGPYGITRHPIYTGFSLALLGLAVTLGEVRVFFGVALCVGAFLRKMVLEDRLLAKTFAAEHDAYRARVKGLIPLVW